MNEQANILRIKLFGKFHVEKNGKVLLRTYTDRARILALLALRYPHPLTSKELSETLGVAVRQRTSELRREIGSEFLPKATMVGRKSGYLDDERDERLFALQLNVVHIEDLDVARFNALIQMNTCESLKKALDLYNNTTLLEDWEEEWVKIERNTWQERLRKINDHYQKLLEQERLVVIPQKILTGANADAPVGPNTAEASARCRATFQGVLPVPKGTDYFVGRENDLVILHRHLTTEGMVGLTQAIAELGGIGKTSLAIEYARRYASYYRAILWLNAASSTLLDTAFARLAKAFQSRCCYSEEAAEVRDGLIAFLEDPTACPPTPPLLLIYDNVEQVTTVNPYVPQTSGVRCLFTSRLGDLFPLVKQSALELDTLNPNEALDFFRQFTNRDLPDDKEEGRAATELAAELGYQHRSEQERLALHWHACDVNAKRCGLETPALASILNHHALLLRDRAQYSQAESLLLHAREIHQNKQDTEQPDMAATLHALAQLYVDQGIYVEAEPLYLRALAIREQVLGSDHPDTAFSLDNLATLYTRQGRYEEAEPLYQRALAIREKILGANHPLTIQSRDNVAQLYRMKSEKGPER